MQNNRSIFFFILYGFLNQEVCKNYLNLQKDNDKQKNRADLKLWDVELKKEVWRLPDIWNDGKQRFQKIFDSFFYAYFLYMNWIWPCWILTLKMHRLNDIPKFVTVSRQKIFVKIYGSQKLEITLDLGQKKMVKWEKDMKNGYAWWLRY